MNTINITFINGNTKDAFIATIDALGFNLVGVPRNKIQQACNCDRVNSQGIYFLVNTKEGKSTPRYLYVGQTKTGPHRLIDHKTKKVEWDMAFMFLAPKSLFPLQVIDELEALEIEKYKNNPAYNFINEKPNKAIPDVASKSIGNIIEEVMQFLGYGSNKSLIDNSVQSENDEVKPTNNFVEGSKIYLDNLGDLTGTKPTTCSLDDNVFDLENSKDYKGYRGMIKYVASLIFHSDNNVVSQSIVKLCSNNAGIGKKAKNPTFSNDPSKLRQPLKIENNIFIEGNVNSQTACHIIKLLLENAGIDIKNFYFTASR